MYEMLVSGEIKALGWREGSSGIFTGSIEGLYQGYRIGSTEPDIQEFTLDLANGSIAITVRQELPTHMPLPSRPPLHPFRVGNAPFDDLNSQRESEMPEEGNIPSTGGMPEPLVINAMEVWVATDPRNCTGIFANASGEMKLTVPEYKIGGYLIVNTQHGDLYMSFLEKGNRQVLKADLWVDGERSTGLYHQAKGTLQFALNLRPPNFASGVYSGTMYLQQQLPD